MSIFPGLFGTSIPPLSLFHFQKLFVILFGPFGNYFSHADTFWHLLMPTLPLFSFLLYIYIYFFYNFTFCQFFEMFGFCWAPCGTFNTFFCTNWHFLAILKEKNLVPFLVFRQFFKVVNSFFCRYKKLFLQILSFQEFGKLDFW